MIEKKYLYWMAVSESEPVRFSELAHLIAKAMYPSDAELNYYGSTRINLDSELPRAVRDGELVVRNPAGMGKHTFPHGAALQSAVMLPSDLRSFLAERGIELRLTAHGSGPNYWTLENAAIALQAQEGWHGGTRAEFLDKLEEAAQRGELVVRDPRTCLPMKSPQARTFWEVVTPADLNAWLEQQAGPYRWNVDATEAEPQAEPGSARPAPVKDMSADDGEKWKQKARQRADEIIKRQRAKDLHPSQEAIADEIAREFRQACIVGAGGKPLTGAYIKRHALKGISSAQNRQLSTSVRRGK